MMFISGVMKEHAVQNRTTGLERNSSSVTYYLCDCESDSVLLCLRFLICKTAVIIISSQWLTSLTVGEKGCRHVSKGGGERIRGEAIRMHSLILEVGSSESG